MLTRSPTLFLKAEAKFDTGFFESGGVIFFSGMSWELEWFPIGGIPVLISAKRAPARATTILYI